MAEGDFMELEFSYENCRFIETVDADAETVDWSDLGHAINWHVRAYMEEEERIEACMA